MQNIEVHTEDEKDLDLDLSSKKLKGHPAIEQGIRRLWLFDSELIVQGNQWKKEINPSILERIKNDLKKKLLQPSLQHCCFILF